MKPEIPNKISFLINGKEENRIVKNYAYTIYDKEGRSIYSNTLNRSECWWEYNDAGLMIHMDEQILPGLNFFLGISH